MNYLIELWVLGPGIRREDWQQTKDLFFVHMSVAQTVAMATTNLKDIHFFAVFHLFAFFARVTLGKIFSNSAVQ